MQYPIFKYMELGCNCGGSCIKPAAEILPHIHSLYNPCNNCNTWKLKKFSPLADQIDLDKINNDFGRCRCGRRHLDIVIAQILKIMIREGIKDKRSTLRETCVPLITPAYPTDRIPYLKENSLVILSDKININCAKRIVDEVSEVKGVLKGDPKITVGIKDAGSEPYVYELLSGCDMRCDVIKSSFGAICIWKNQSKIHIEFSRSKSPKIEILEEILKKHDKPRVIDCTCGPGTLGILCLKAGAREVLFNDLWYPAAKMAAINLEVNGFPVKMNNKKKGLIASGHNAAVCCMDIRKLHSVIDEGYDICIVDTFPEVDPGGFVDVAKKIGDEVIVI